MFFRKKDKYISFSILILQLSLIYILSCFSNTNELDHIDDAVLVVIVIKKKHHLLPHFLYLFEDLSYPKDKLALFLRVDQSENVKIDELEFWIKQNEHKYHSVNQRFHMRSSYGEVDDEFWGYNEMREIIEYKEEGLNHARNMSADFVWIVDLGAFHTYPNVLQRLIKHNKTVVSPLLTAESYANFWAHMTESYWFKRSDEYLDIITNDKTGCFPVALAFESVLINLNHKGSKDLTFINKNNYQINPSPLIDNIIFSLTAQENGVNINVCNDAGYGQTLPVTMESINIGDQIKYLTILLANDITNKIYKGTARFNQRMFGNIYCINLKRRPDRRENMQRNFKKLGFEGIFVDAIDWKEFNETYLKSLDVRVLKNYDKGDMTYGLIGNFLSHYFIWEEVIRNHFEQVIILEDDVNFHDDFLERRHALTKEIATLDLDWDLIYLGRRPLNAEEETRVNGSELLVKPAYTWWTIGYMLSYNGAVKLYEQKPLEKIIPIDEYIPIMFDQHPEEKFKKFYNPRNVNAFAVEPSVLEPTHYSNEAGYISDTSQTPDVAQTLDNHVFQAKDIQHPSKTEL